MGVAEQPGEHARIGIDTGGTFTDFVWLENGRLRIFKTSSTPDDPARAILHGIETREIPETTAVVHGSTVATNALLERRGARTLLVTTAGFEDVLAIGRQNRPDIYELVPQRPEPLVPPTLLVGVDERVGADGVVVQPLTPADIDFVVTTAEMAMFEYDIESVAVSLLFSFLHPEHEEALAEALRTRYPTAALHVSLSSEILPEYREYERTATTVINAYVAPIMERYLGKLARGVAPRSLTVMQSNGGVIGAETAGEQAARTCLSGPAGGVVGARYVAELAGFDQIITFDMGGTSTDVALCDRRLPTTTSGEIAGLPLRLPIIDIHTVGAGGGSLAAPDAGGALHVGPRSAGAVPGPACYGRGGVQATTTDANLVTGRLDARHFLGGEMALDVDAANRAVANLAGALGRGSGRSSLAVTAADVLRVANVTMERAIRRISVERGFDPRAFTLVPFGGAGPLHACELAEALRIPRVLIPPIPGVLSALGMLVAAPTRDYSRTVLRPLPEDGSGDDELLAEFEDLVFDAEYDMEREEGYSAEHLTLRRAVDMRYAGQSHELTVWVDPDDPRPLAARFHDAHRRRYGYRQTASAVEAVTIRLAAEAPVTVPELPAAEEGDADPAAARVGEKEVWFTGRWHPTTLYDRARLRPGHQLAGPAVLFQYDTTTVVSPGWHARVDRYSNLLLEHGAQ